MGDDASTPLQDFALLQCRWLRPMLLSEPVPKKPTTLLLLRLDSFRHEMLRLGLGGRCPHAKGAHQRLQGRNENGEFRTAIGKIYPHGLNAALGRAIRRFAALTFDCKLLAQELPEELRAFTQQVFEAPDTVQPDFHGAEA